MTANDPIAEILPEVVAWRHKIHANPELGFEEHDTAAFVAEKLRSFGLEVHSDVSATAVVGVLRKGDSDRRVALRADMDALPIQEKAAVPYASKTPGVMHACGHDGHSAMLLGAAKLLAGEVTFDGTIAFVFQPAEEVVGGGRRMVADGLFRRFPAEKVFAIHNWPGFPAGHIGVLEGPQMAAVDDFSLTVTGKGAHAAMPHLGDDPILAAADLITGLQRVVSRSADPMQALVLSVTQVHGGRFNNFVPGEVRIEGTCRFFDPALSEHCRTEIQRVAEGVGATHGLCLALDYRPGYPPVVNSEAGAADALAAAADALGTGRAASDFQPSMGCDDFAFMLQAVGEGAYAWIGAGEVAAGEGLHGDHYVFNDEAVLPAGIRYWVSLAQRLLPAGK